MFALCCDWLTQFHCFSPVFLHKVPLITLILVLGLSNSLFKHYENIQESKSVRY